MMSVAVPRSFGPSTDSTTLTTPQATTTPATARSGCIMRSSRRLEPLKLSDFSGGMPPAIQRMGPTGGLGRLAGTAAWVRVGALMPPPPPR
jgi:hypothetical protein